MYFCVFVNYEMVNWNELFFMVEFVYNNVCKVLIGMLFFFVNYGYYFVFNNFLLNIIVYNFLSWLYVYWMI